MTIKKTISAWLIMENGENKGKVLLQKRSIEDSFPFICQATWAGGIEPNEDAYTALLRECKEELGDNFFKKYDFSKIESLAKEIFSEAGRSRETNNYLGKINEDQLKAVKIHKEAFENFIFVGKNDLVYTISSGKNPRDNIVLFDDQYEILKDIIINNGN